MNHVEIKRRQIEMGSYLLGILTVWILAYKLGQGGIAYLTVGMVAFVCFFIIPAGNIGDTIGKILRNKNMKGQYSNVSKLKKDIIIMQSILAVLASVLLFVFATPIAEYIFKVPYSAVIICVLAPVILLRTITAVLIGFFQGEGTELPATITCVIRQIFILGFGLLFSNIFMNYGTKISRLLLQEQLVPMYGGVGIAVGIALTEFLLVIFLLVLYKGSKRSYQRKNTEGAKVKGTFIDSLRFFYGNRVNGLLLDILKFFPVIIGLVLYQKNTENINAGILNLESFFVKFFLICALVIIPLCAFMIPLFAKVYYFIRKEEMRYARNMFQTGLHIGVAGAMFPTVFVACMSEQIAGIFSMTGQQIAADMLRAGSFLILFVVLNFYFAHLLKLLGKHFYLLGGLGIYNILFIGILVLFLTVMKLDIMALVYSGLIANIVYCLILGFFLCRQLRYGLAMLLQLAVPVIAASITGLLCILLSKVFTPHLGNEVTVIACGVLAFILYWVMLLLLRNFREQELDNIPGGRIIRAIGELLHVF